jgi:hypothetical protein
METTKPGDAILRHYFVGTDGEILFVESFVAPGWYKCSRLSHTGAPLDGKLVSFGDLSRMRMFSNLREARAVAGMTATRNAKMRATLGDLIR